MRPALVPILFAPPLWVPRGSSGARAIVYSDFANGRYWFNRRFPDLASWLAAGSGTFSRASTASYTNSAGLLATAASGALRFDYDPVTLAPKGILLEGARTNIVSNSLTGAGWSVTGVSVTGNSTTAPDGSNAGVLVTENTSSSTHDTFGTGFSVTAGANAASVYVKGGTRRFISIRAETVAATTWPWLTLDTQNGTITNNGAATALFAVQSLSNGWYRVSIVFTAVGGAGSNVVIAGSNVSTAPTTNSAQGNSYTGTSSTFYYWGAQLEVGSSVSSDIPTTSGSVTRAADALALTLPANVSTITYTFDDNSTQSASVSPGAFTVPTNLNRPNIKSLAVFQ